MGFRDAKRLLLQAMQEGRITHEPREAEKNLLASGELTPGEAYAIVASARGPGVARPHHLDPTFMVWVVQPVVARRRWYIKFYLVEDDAFFISFHEAGQ